MKRKFMIIIALVVCIIMPNTAVLANTYYISAMNGTAQVLIDNKVFEYIGADVDWSVLALARMGRISESQTNTYYNNLVNTLKEQNGILHERKYTEYSRTVLTLSSLGIDATDVGGYNLIEKICEKESVVWQGINGPIYALLALDSRNYDCDVRSYYIQAILDAQADDGSFTLAKSDATGDIDITAMALQALSRYKDTQNVSKTIDSALAYLSQKQCTTGGYELYGTQNAESAVQVLLALTELGIDIDDARFVKDGNTVLDALLTYHMNGGFSHVIGGNKDAMATEQALCALVSYDRVQNSKTSLYDMSDVSGFDKTNEPKNNTVVRVPEISMQDKTFDDISGSYAKTQIEKLAMRQIINGFNESQFAPDKTMTRAEFTAIIVRGLGLENTADVSFVDVNPNDWFYSYVSSGAEYGIINGVSETEFAPNNTITRQEAAVMLMRSGVLCGMNTELSEGKIQDALTQFDDYTDAELWSRQALAFCVDSNMILNDSLELMPKQEVTRADVAYMLCTMLESAKLI